MKYVYFLRTGNDFYKVGIANDVNKRLKTIQTSSPQLVELVTMRLVEYAEQVESSLHRYVSEHRSGGGNEWFRLTPGQALDVAIKLNSEPQLALHSAKMSMESFFAALEQEKRDRVSMLKQIHELVKKLVEEKPAVERENIEQKISSIAPESPVVGNVPTLGEYEQKALALFKAEGRASASLLQRKFSIGYAKAARIVDAMEAKGLVGPISNTPAGRALHGTQIVLSEADLR